MSGSLSCVAVIVASAEWPSLERIGGRSLLARCVATARAADGVGEVLVVSPAQQVLNEARRVGAEPVPVQDSNTSPFDALVVLDALATAERETDIVVVIDPAAALIDPADIDGGILSVAEHGADAAVASVKVAGVFERDLGGPLSPVTPGRGGQLFADASVIRVLRLSVPPERQASPVVALPLPPERALRVAGPASLRAVTAIIAAEDPSRDADRLPLRPGGLVMDFDGVFTDNRVVVNQDGIESVLCSRGDGMGLEHLRARGLPMLVLSKERNPVVSARCAKLKLECRQAVDEKGPALLGWCREQDLDPADVVYIGNDTNDLPCFGLVGCAVAVADSHPAALAAADVVLTRNGGFGALRELTDQLALRLDTHR